MNSENYYKMIIDRESVESVSKKYISIQEPSKKKHFAYVPRGNGEDVKKATIPIIDDSILNHTDAVRRVSRVLAIDYIIFCHSYQIG